MNLGISVDWDFFFPDLAQWDYGHKESPFFINQVWTLRASSPNNPNPIEKITPRESYKRFWHRLSRLGLTPPICFVAESHSINFDLIQFENVDTLLVFDQHVDAYDKHHDSVTCENWLLMALRKAPQLRAYLVLPAHQWIDDKTVFGLNGLKIPEDVANRLTILNDNHFEGLARREFKGAVVLASFICRSGAWTPPWADEHFKGFLEDVTWEEFPDHGILERPFNREAALEVRHFLRIQQQNTPFFSKSGFLNAVSKLRRTPLLLEVPFGLS